MSPSLAGAPLLRVNDLSVEFATRSGPFRARRTVRAVAGVDLQLQAGETLGIVGESGSGKSSLGRAVVGLQRPRTGSVLLWGIDRYAGGKAAATVRTTAQMVFQDPCGSLNPRKTIGRSIADPLGYTRAFPKGPQRRERVRELLALVGLEAEVMDRYPHEFSGGQLQRACIAKAVALESGLLVCDEAVSALDAIHRRQILDLFGQLKERLGLAYLFISHDLAAVREVSDRIAVMHLGSFVEVASARALAASPRHPYSQALLASVPLADPRQERLRTPLLLTGEPPSPLDPPSGCCFRTRCPGACERCREERPALREIEPGHSVACHFIDSWRRE